jgi:phospholipid/cholesterol/gamma-HCH transport system permease protein
MTTVNETTSTVPPPEPDRVPGPATAVREKLVNSGLILKFTGTVLRDTFSGRVLAFTGETIRLAGVLIVSSALFIWGLIFIIGLQCGIEGAYLLQSQGAPQYAGLFAAWCDLRELAPLCFGYMMAAKVGTGIVAELGSMRISEEIDALEVMGISGITFLCATRLLASWLIFPFVYLSGVAWGFLASYIAVVQQVGNVSAGGYSLIFWEFQNPGDLLFSLIKAMVMATVIVLVGCYFGYTAKGGPVGVGEATAKSMVVNIVSVHIIGMLGTQLFWGANPRAPIGG